MQHKRSIQTLQRISIDTFLNEILVPNATSTHHHELVFDQWKQIIAINKQKVIDFVFYHETNFVHHNEPYDYIPIPLHLLSLVESSPHKVHKTLLIKNVNQFIQKPPGKQCRRKRITIGLFEFVLHLYPNGLTQINNGFVAYFVELTKIPLNVQHIVLYVHLFCAQTDTIHKESVIFHQKGDSEGWIWPLWTKHCQEHEFLQFGAELQVLELVYNPNTNLNSEHYVSSDLTVRKGMTYEYEWKWNELKPILNAIKHVQHPKQKLVFLTDNSDDDVFCFAIEYDPHNDGQMWIHCKMLQLPLCLDGMQAMIDFEMGYKTAFTFDYKHNDCTIKLTRDDMDWLLSSQHHDLSFKICVQITDAITAQPRHITFKTCWHDMNECLNEYYQYHNHQLKDKFLRFIHDMQYHQCTLTSIVQNEVNEDNDTQHWKWELLHFEDDIHCFPIPSRVQLDSVVQRKHFISYLLSYLYQYKKRPSYEKMSDAVTRIKERCAMDEECTEWDKIMQREDTLMKEHQHLVVMQNTNKAQQLQMNVQRKVLNGELVQIKNMIKELEKKQHRLEMQQTELEMNQNEIYAMHIQMAKKQKRIIAQQNECKQRKDVMKRQRKQDAYKMRMKQEEDIDIKSEIKQLIEMKREEKLMGIWSVNGEEVDITEMNDDDISVVMRRMMDKQQHVEDPDAASWICGRCQFLNKKCMVDGFWRYNNGANECALCGHAKVVFEEVEDASDLEDSTTCTMEESKDNSTECNSDEDTDGASEHTAEDDNEVVVYDKVVTIIMESEAIASQSNHQTNAATDVVQDISHSDTEESTTSRVPSHNTESTQPQSQTSKHETESNALKEETKTTHSDRAHATAVIRAQEPASISWADHVRTNKTLDTVSDGSKNRKKWKPQPETSKQNRTINSDKWLYDTEERQELQDWVDSILIPLHKKETTNNASKQSEDDTESNQRETETMCHTPKKEITDSRVPSHTDNDTNKQETKTAHPDHGAPKDITPLAPAQAERPELVSADKTSDNAVLDVCNNRKRCNPRNGTSPPEAVNKTKAYKHKNDNAFNKKRTNPYKWVPKMGGSDGVMIESNKIEIKTAHLETTVCDASKKEIADSGVPSHNTNQNESNQSPTDNMDKTANANDGSKAMEEETKTAHPDADASKDIRLAQALTAVLNAAQLETNNDMKACKQKKDNASNKKTKPDTLVYNSEELQELQDEIDGLRRSIESGTAPNYPIDIRNNACTETMQCIEIEIEKKKKKKRDNPLDHSTVTLQQHPALWEEHVSTDKSFEDAVLNVYKNREQCVQTNGTPPDAPQPPVSEQGKDIKAHKQKHKTPNKNKSHKTKHKRKKKKQKRSKKEHQTRNTNTNPNKQNKPLTIDSDVVKLGALDAISNIFDGNMKALAKLPKCDTDPMDMFEKLLKDKAISAFVDTIPDKEPSSTNHIHTEISIATCAVTACDVADADAWVMEANTLYCNAEMHLRRVWRLEEYRIFGKERVEWLTHYDSDATHSEVVREYVLNEVDCCTHMDTVMKAYMAYADRKEVILNEKERDAIHSALTVVLHKFVFIEDELREFIQSKGRDELPPEFVMIIINIKALQEAMDNGLKVLNKLNGVHKERAKRRKWADDRRKAKHIQHLLRESPRIQNQKRKLENEMKHYDEIFKTIRRHKDIRAIKRFVSEAKEGGQGCVTPEDSICIPPNEMHLFVNTNKCTKYHMQRYELRGFMFEVSIYPNGYNEHSVGFVQFMIKCLDAPDIAESVAIYLQLTEKYSKSESRCTKLWTVPVLLNTFIRWHNDILSLQTCRNECTQLEFMYVIDVLETNQSTNSVMNYCGGVKLIKDIDWFWKIDKDLITAIKYCIATKAHRCFYVNHSKHKEICLSLETIPIPHGTIQPLSNCLIMSLNVFKLPTMIQTMELLFELDTVALSGNGKKSNLNPGNCKRVVEHYTFEYGQCQSSECRIHFSDKHIASLLDMDHGFRFNIKVNGFRLWFKGHMGTPYVYDPTFSVKGKSNIHKRNDRQQRDNWIKSIPMHYGSKNKQKNKNYKKKHKKKVKKKEKKAKPPGAVVKVSDIVESEEVNDNLVELISRKEKQAAAAFRRRFGVDIDVLSSKSETWLKQMEKNFLKDKQRTEQELKYIYSLFYDSSDSDDTNYNKHHKCINCRCRKKS
eukprot:629822_1